MLMEKFELKCEIHNKNLKEIVSDDRHTNYVCLQCEFERTGKKIN